MEYIYQAWGGGGVKANLFFLSGGGGGCGVFKTNLYKKVGGVKEFFFSMTTVQITFFFKWEGKAGRGDDPGQLKNSGRVGT